MGDPALNETNAPDGTPIGTVLDPVPHRLDILGGAAAENDELAARLDMNLPGRLADAPPTLAFDRVREVNLPWAELVEAMSRNEDGLVSTTAPLRSYFERSWWGEDRATPSAADLAELFEDGLIVVVWASGEDQPDNPLLFWNYAEDDKGAAKGEPLASGIVLRHAISGRYYLIGTTSDGNGETEPSAGPDLAKTLATPKGYADFWDNRADEATMVFAAEADVVGSQTVYDELDLRAVYIERRFRELKVMQEIVTAASAKAAGALDGILELGAGTDLNFEAMDAVQARYVSIRLGPYRIRRNLLQLKRQAAQMGYLLFLGDEPGMRVITAAADGNPEVVGMKVKFPDGNDKDVLAGELYTTFKRQCSYTVTHKKSIMRNVGESIVYGFKRLFGGRTEKQDNNLQGNEIQDRQGLQEGRYFDRSAQQALPRIPGIRQGGVCLRRDAGWISDRGRSVACQCHDALRT